MRLSFFINVIAIIIVDIVIGLFFWAAKTLGIAEVGPETIVTTLTNVLPVEVLLLMTHDLAYKLVERNRLRKINKMAPEAKEIWLKEHVDDRKLSDRLSWTYYIGVVMIFTAVGTFYWASIMPTWAEASVFLRFTLFFAVLGAVWMFWIYKTSVQTHAERAVESWDVGRRKMRRARTIQDGIRVLGTYLRVHFHGNTLGGALDFDRPLAPYKGEFLTYVELLKLDKKHTSDEVKAMLSSVEAELRAYVRQNKALIEEMPCAQENVELA